MDERLEKEEKFHDEWAEHEDVLSIDVLKTNEAVTAPEMRYIRRVLGDLRGKTLLDIGSGLGEASVYFALLGARVTALDISEGMLKASAKLAEKYGVSLEPHHAAAEDLRLDSSKKFDVIYVGNAFHHVDIEQVLAQLAPHLKDDGMLVSWDPVAYNPVINLYRRIATETRTPDEHPLRLRDIRLFRKYFREVQTSWFWLTTLAIFICMALFQRRNPNKERFWKKVVEEGDRWAWMYRPLEALDRVLLRILPFLGPLCWNVVIVARKPRKAA